jgi:hypothetical protein
MPGAAAPDQDLPTVHLRCGSDIFGALRAAGFTGELVEFCRPYGEGDFQDDPLVLAATASRGRVVIWSEHDRWDLLVLVRMLDLYAQGPRPPRLELILIDRHPGFETFLGLGQLDAAQLRQLWETRSDVTAGQLALGRDVWAALTSADPRPLAAIAATGTPALPLLAAALRRHLAELPGVGHGLSRTQWLLLSQVASAPATVDQLLRWINAGGDVLPGITDLVLLATLQSLERPPESALRREPGTGRRPWSDRCAATAFGRRLLAGEADWLATKPPVRRVGGVPVAADHPDLRWDEHRSTVVADGRGNAPQRVI